MRDESESRAREKGTWSSTTYAAPAGLSEDDSLLLQLRQEERLPWRDIAARYQNEKGKNFHIEALELRCERLLQKFRIWEEPSEGQVISDTTKSEKQFNDNSMSVPHDLSVDVSSPKPSDDTGLNIDNWRRGRPTSSRGPEPTILDSGMGSTGARSQAGVGAVPMSGSFDLTTLDEIESRNAMMTRQQRVMKDVDANPVLFEHSAWLAKESSSFPVVDDPSKRWTSVSTHT